MKKIYLLLLTVLFLGGLSMQKSLADCTLPAGVTNASAFLATYGPSGTEPCSGTLFIPNGADLVMNANLTIPSAITRIVIQADGQIIFNSNNTDLTLGSGTSIEILQTSPISGTGAAIENIGSCTNNRSITIGTTKYSACTGGGNVCLLFSALVAQGGTLRLNPIISVGSSTSFSGNTTCFGPFQLNAQLVGNTGLINPPTYIWTQTAGPSASFSSTSIANPVITPSAPGTYSFKVQVEQNLSTTGCSIPLNEFVTIESTITIIVRPVPTISISIAPAAVCQNTTGPTVTFTNNLALPVTVTFTSSPNSTSPVSPINVPANGTATTTGLTATAGSNLITVTQVAYQDGTPSCTNTTGLPSDSYTVDPIPTLTLTTANADQNICPSVPITPISFNVTGASTASATGLAGTGLTGTFTAGSPGVFIISGTPTVPGPIMYTVSTSGGSCSATPATATGTITIGSFGTPATPSAISGPTTTCPGTTNLAYSVTLVAGVTYAWTVPATWVITAGQGTNSITVTAGSCTAFGDISVTASNTCGTSGASTLGVSSVDNVGPTWTTAALALDRTVECSDATAMTAAQALVPAASDLCDMALGAPVKTPGSLVAGACPQEGTITNTWVVTDACGNTSVAYTQVITVTDNAAPIGQTTAPSTTNINACYIDATTPPVGAPAFSATAAAGGYTDNCGGTVTATLTSTAVVQTGCNWVLTYRFSVSDACGNSLTNQVITHSGGDTTPPTFTGDGTVIVQANGLCAVPVTPAPTASDNCSTPSTPTFVDKSQTCYPSNGGGTLNAAGSYFPIAVNGLKLAKDLRKVDLTFQTNQGVGRAEFVLITPDGLHGIVLVGNYCEGGNCEVGGVYSPTLYSNTLGAAYPVWNNVTNAAAGAGNYRPTGSLTTGTGLPNTVTLHATFEELPGTGVGNWQIYARKQAQSNGDVKFNSGCLTFDETCTKTVTRTWSSTDACGNVGTFEQTIIIEDKAGPTITCPMNVTVNSSPDVNDCKANYLIPTPVITDNCSSANLVTVQYTMSGATILNTLSNIPTSAVVLNEGVTTINYVATDGCGNTSTCSYDVTVNCCTNVISGSLMFGSGPTITGTAVSGDAHVSLLKMTAPATFTTIQTEALPTGTFTFKSVGDGKYRVVLHKTAAGSQTPSLPTGAYNTFVAEGALGTVGDRLPTGTPNGIIELELNCGVITYNKAKVAAVNNVDASFLINNVALPVRLLSFEGKPTEKGNKLTWKTSSESNFSHYEVERGVNAKAFKMIGKVSGASANTKEVLSYNFLDENNQSGMVPGATSATSNIPAAYYRLKMVDLDGSSEYSKVIFIDKEIEKSIVGDFYPNPAFGNEVSINITSSDAKLWTITSYDVSGKVINTETRQLNKGENKLKFDSKINRSGISIYRFESTDGVQFRKLSN